jgi:RNA polymerase sigma-70 factor (ECF subfamily)
MHQSSSITHELGWEIDPCLAQARGGDPEAFGVLCRQIEPRLFRQAVALCGHAAMAEDLAQETLLAAWKNLRRYDGQCRFFTWICGILIHRHQNFVRKKKAVAFSSLGASETESAQRFLHELAEPGAGPAEMLLLGEREAALRSCLERLPGKHRQVVYLRFFVDASLDEIAVVLGCSTGTVKSRLFNGLEKLHQMPELKGWADH